MFTEVAIEKTKRGIPCLWERGGGYSNTGKSFIITGKYGQPKKAVYIKRKGELACGEHALIPVAVGDFIVSASHHRGDFDIQLYLIKNINLEESKAEVALVNRFSQNEWDNTVWDEISYPQIEKALLTAADKAACYHCREAFFVKED